MALLCIGVALAGEAAYAEMTYEHEYVFDDSSDRGKDTGRWSTIALSPDGTPAPDFVSSYPYGGGDALRLDAAGEVYWHSTGHVKIKDLGMADAFTLEAIVKIDALDKDRVVINLDDSGAYTNRPFAFKIENDTLAFAHISVLNFPAADIPTTGPHAFDADGWFHIAFTYDGTPNTAGNAEFYWTRVGVSASANSIGINDSGMMTADFGANEDGLFVIGAYANNFTENPLAGLVDRVRIHGTELQSGDFAVPIPEPGTALLLLLGASLLAVRQWWRS
jgi:hypothetical protein